MANSIRVSISLFISGVFSKFQSLLVGRSSLSGDDATGSQVPDRKVGPAFEPESRDMKSELPGAPVGETAWSVVGSHSRKWQTIMVSFCLLAALEVPLVSLHVPSQLSTAYAWHCMGVLLGFASFFVSSFINPKFVRTARVLQSSGRIFTVTTFFLLIIFPFPLSLKITGWAFYAVCLNNLLH